MVEGRASEGEDFGERVSPERSRSLHALREEAALDQVGLCELCRTVAGTRAEDSRMQAVEGRRTGTAAD